VQNNLFPKDASRDGSCLPYGFSRKQGTFILLPMNAFLTAFAVPDWSCLKQAGGADGTQHLGKQ